MQGAWEAGGSIVTFVMVLPILAVLLCAALDFGRIVVCQMMLSDASYAALNWSCERVSQGARTPLAADAARRAALAAAPALDGADFSVEIVVGEASEEKFARRIYSEADGSFSKEDVQVSACDVKSRAKLKAPYLTVVGRAVAAAGGSSDGTFTLEALSQRRAYAPEGGSHVLQGNG